MSLAGAISFASLYATRWRPAEPEGKMPWPLTREELARFQSHGLKAVSFEDFIDDEEPPVRRFRATYRRE